MNGKRYNTLNNELLNIFGSKVMKLCLDGGFTCPNRDGSIGREGCIFCSEEGSGEFAGSRLLSLKDQAEEQKKLLSKKWKADKYIAYFQNFSNTYAKVERLEKIYEEALSIDGVVGLAIATRPDCIDDDVVELLSRLNRKTFIWVELGLQSIHESSSRFIRRGYPLSTYDDAVSRLKKENIRVVTHLIVGLPFENKEDILESVKYVAQTNTWGIKLHSLYIQEGTDLYEYFLNNPFSLFTREEYIDIIIQALGLLPKDMVIHRLTGDGKKELLYQPKWSADKLKLLSLIDKELKDKNLYQSFNFR